MGVGTFHDPIYLNEGPSGMLILNECCVGICSHTVAASSCWHLHLEQLQKPYVDCGPGTEGVKTPAFPGTISLILNSPGGII